MKATICRQVQEHPVVSSPVETEASYYHATKLYWFFIEQISDGGLCFDVSVKKISEALGLAGEFIGTTNDFMTVIIEPLMLEVSKKTELVAKCSIVSNCGQDKFHFALKDMGWKKLSLN